jgi:hypothetical protein
VAADSVADAADSGNAGFEAMGTDLIAVAVLVPNPFIVRSVATAATPADSVATTASTAVTVDTGTTTANITVTTTVDIAVGRRCYDIAHVTSATMGGTGNVCESGRAW